MQPNYGARPGWLRRCVVGLLFASTISVTVGGTAAQPSTLDDVIALASAYVENLFGELSTIVTEEDYRQSYFPRASFTNNPRRLRLRSEFLLVLLENTSAWTGFRDIFEVNGNRVRDRQDRLAEIFLGDTDDAMRQAQRIVDESSRYNLGTTGRTFNIPTYALSYLHPSNVQRFVFEKDGEGCGDNRAAWDISYEEVDVPTITRGFQNINLPSRGKFCIDSDTGTILKTEIRLSHPAFGSAVKATDATATVTFALDPDVELWVPNEMRERYQEIAGGRTISTARYSNYRKFRVSTNEGTGGGRLLPE
ncbi:uncharacterized protein METZ01_LOCUS49170 [marine metagenome]|uniref:Uncharacterized protein n=1 Tax=marine metagenome TaxID=408172 RepID=A0A381RWU2_9ZZZZ